MKTIEVRKATRSLAAFAKEVREPVVILKSGKPFAALVPVEDQDLESLSLSTNEEFMAMLEKSRAQVRQGKTISQDEMRRRLGLPKAKKKRLA